MSTAPTATPLVTKLNRPWLAKMIIFCTVLVFFGCWGLYDALVAFPARGTRYASYLQYQYLDVAKTDGMMHRNLGVENPAEEYARLGTTDKSRLTRMDQAKLAWLHALSIVGKLDRQFTKFDDAAAKHTELKAVWTTSAGGGKKAPKELGRYDIPIQWLFVAVGLGGGLWMIVHFINVKRKRYTWDPATQTLTLPDGNCFTPADLAEELDKRKWDKFLVFVKIKPTHPTLGGQTLKLDLYQHAHLEGWIEEMGRTAFPESHPPATPSEDAAAEAAPAL